MIIIKSYFLIVSSVLLLNKGFAQTLQCVDPDTKQRFNDGDKWEKNCWVYVCSAGTSNWRITVDGRAAICIGSAKDEGSLSSGPGQGQGPARCTESSTGQSFVDGETWFHDCWLYICTIDASGEWTLSPTHRVTGHCNSRCFNGDCNALKCVEPETTKLFLNGQTWSRGGFDYICKASETGWTITPVAETSKNSSNRFFVDPETQKTHKNGDVFSKNGWNFQSILGNSGGWEIRPLSMNSNHEPMSSTSIDDAPLPGPPQPVVSATTNWGTTKCTDKQTGLQYNNGETFNKGVWTYQCTATLNNWKIAPIALLNNPMVILGSGIMAIQPESSVKCMDSKSGKEYQNGETMVDGGQTYKCIATGSSQSLQPLPNESLPAEPVSPIEEERKCRDRDTKMEYSNGQRYVKDGWEYECSVDSGGWRIVSVGEASPTLPANQPVPALSPSPSDTSNGGCTDIVDGQSYNNGDTWSRNGVTYRCTVMIGGLGWRIDEV